MRKTYLISIIIITIIIAVITGIILHNNKNIEQKESKEISNTQQNKKIENLIDNNVEIVTTVSEEEKTSPNCIFIFKTHYDECSHIKVEKQQIPEEMVNKTREELEELYKTWTVVTFRNSEVLFYKEKEGNCGEHYLLKELDGVIAIYTVEDNEEQKLKEKTEIVTSYLPEEDLTKLKEGIRVNGKEKLNQVLEDYE